MDLTRAKDISKKVEHMSRTGTLEKGSMAKR